MNAAHTRPIVMEDIARSAGVHRSTVSLSLRNHASIPVDTRLRIQTLARRLGYRPDPLLSSFNAQTVKRRQHTTARTLAFVHDLPTQEAFVASRRHQELLLGATERAGFSGSRFEVFSLSRSGLSPTRLNQVLETRGISGVLLAALDASRPFPELACETYAALAVDTLGTPPRVDALVPNYRETARRALLHLHACGCRRPALLFSPRVPSDVLDGLRAGTLGNGSETSIEPAVLYPWKNDAHADRKSPVLSSCDGVLLCGVPLSSLTPALSKQPTVSLDFGAALSSLAGVRPWYRGLGSVGFDLLVERLQLNVFGLPKFPVTLEFPLLWEPSGTA